MQRKSRKLAVFLSLETLAAIIIITVLLAAIAVGVAKVLDAKDVSIVIKEQKQLKEAVTAFYIIAKRYPGDVPLTNNLFKENISNAAIIQDVQSLTGLTTAAASYLINPGTDVIGKEKQYLAFAELSSSGVSALISQKVTIPSTPQITKYEQDKAAVQDTYAINKVVSGTDGIENLTCSPIAGTTLISCSAANDTSAQTSTINIVWKQDHGTTVAPPKVSYTKYVLSNANINPDLTTFFGAPTKVAGSAMVQDTYTLSSATLSNVYNIESMTCSGCTTTPTYSCTGSGTSRVCKVTATWKQDFGTAVVSPTNVTSWGAKSASASTASGKIDGNWTAFGSATTAVNAVPDTYTVSTTPSPSYGFAYCYFYNLSGTPTGSPGGNITVTSHGSPGNSAVNEKCTGGTFTVPYAETPSATFYYGGQGSGQYCPTSRSVNDLGNDFFLGGYGSCGSWGSAGSNLRYCYGSNPCSYKVSYVYASGGYSWNSANNTGGTLNMVYIDKKGSDYSGSVTICCVSPSVNMYYSVTPTLSSRGNPLQVQQTYYNATLGVLNGSATFSPVVGNTLTANSGEATTSGAWTKNISATVGQGTNASYSASGSSGSAASASSPYYIISNSTQQIRSGYSPSTTYSYSYYPITLNTSALMNITSLTSAPAKTAGVAEVLDKYSITNFTWNNVQVVSAFTCPSGWTCSFTRSGRNMLVSLSWSQAYNSALGKTATMTVTRNNPEVVSNGVSTDKFGSATLLEGSYYVPTVQQDIKSSIYYKQNKYILNSEIGDGATWGIVLDNSAQLANTPSDSIIYDSTYNGYSDWNGVLRFILYGVSSSSVKAIANGGLISATDSFGGISGKLAKMIDEKFDNGMPLAKKSNMISENVRTTAGFGCNSARVLGAGSYTNPTNAASFETSTYLSGSGFDEGCIVTFKAMA